MGELRVKVPDKLHKTLKREALNKDTTLTKLIINILETYISSSCKPKEEKTKESEKD